MKKNKSVATWKIATDYRFMQMKEKLLDCESYEEYKMLCEIGGLEYFNCDCIADLINDSSLVDTKRLIHELAEMKLKKNNI